MIFLSGCQSLPKEVTVTQRFIDLEMVTVNGELMIDPDLSFCLIREYTYSVDYIGPKSKFQKFPLSECNKVNGYSPRDYTDVYEYMEAVRQEIQEHEQGI
jgi:hypothetical protein